MKEVVVKHIQVKVGTSSLIDADVCAVVYDFPNRRFGDTPYVEIKFVQTGITYIAGKDIPVDDYNHLAARIVEALREPVAAPTSSEQKFNSYPKWEAMKDQQIQLIAITAPAQIDGVEHNADVFAIAYAWPQLREGEKPFRKIEITMVKTENHLWYPHQIDATDLDYIIETVEKHLNNEANYPIWLQKILSHPKVSGEQKEKAKATYELLKANPDHEALSHSWINIESHELLHAFKWGQTREGVDYWNDIDDIVFPL